MAVAVPNTNISSSASSTTHTVSLPAGITAGDLLLIFIELADNAVTASPPAGWTEIVTGVNGGRSYFFARLADGSEGSTVNITSSAAEKSAHASYRITGHEPDLSTNGISFATPATGSSVSPNPPNNTTGWPSEPHLAIAAVGIGSASPNLNAYPSNYTTGQRYSATSAGFSSAVAIASRSVTSTDDDPGNFTLSGGQSWVAYTLAIRELQPKPASGFFLFF